MSEYTDREYSFNNSVPVECYHIYSEGEEYFYTTAEKNVELIGMTFIPAIIEREELETSSSKIMSNLKLNMDSQEDFVRLNSFRFGKAPVYIKAFRLQIETDPLEEYVVFFFGKITSISLSGEVAEISASFSGLELKSKLLSYTSSKLCPHNLYGFMCGVNKNLFTFNGTITAFGDNETEIHSPLFETLHNTPYGYNLQLGNIFNDNTFENRVIQSHGKEVEGDPTDYSVIYVIRPFTSGLINQAITVRIGCNKMFLTCKDWFQNRYRFGGFDDIPVENPYSEAKIMRYR